MSDQIAVWVIVQFMWVLHASNLPLGARFRCKIQVQDWCKIFGSLKLCSDIFSAQRYLNII